MIGHLVLFNPRAAVAPDKLRSFAKSISDACRDIRSIKRVQVGRRIVVNAGYARNFGDKTYKYAAVFEFEDLDGLRQYLNHPRHQELGRMFWEVCDSTTVLEVQLLDGRSDQLAEFLLEDQ